MHTNYIDISYLKYNGNEISFDSFFSKLSHQAKKAAMETTSVTAPDIDTCVHLTSSSAPFRRQNSLSITQS